MEEVIELQKQQIALLSQLVWVLGNQNQKLGFGASPRPQYIYCNRTQPGALWYMLSNDANRTPIAIKEAALTCYIQQLEFKQVERRGKETWKTHLHVKADRPYILESGYDSHFSKGLIMALGTIEYTLLRNPVTIEVQAASDSEEVLFGRLYANNELIFAPYNNETDWRVAAKRAVGNVSLAVNPE